MSKKYLSVFFVAVMLISVFSIFSDVTVITASASYEDIWTPKSASNAIFSMDYKNKNSGEYSLKIQNFDYEDTWYSKTISVEKNTTYKISATVKYEDYELKSGSSESGGANISIAGEWKVSEIYNKSTWKKINLEFNSGTKTNVTICLRNGFYYGACKGTAWFSDVKIEKKDMTPTTNWDFLFIIYKNIDINLNTFRGNKNYHYQNSFSQKDVDEITSAARQIKKTFPKISDNLMTVSDVTVVSVDTPLTSITGKYNGGLCIEPEDIRESLDLYLSRKSYNQIIVIAPLGELANGWDGLGGGFYKDFGYAQISHTPDEKFGSENFPDAVFIHETLHCIESRAKKIKSIANLHDGKDYKYNGDNDWIEWYGDYMKDALPDGKGLPKEAYNVYNGRFNVISSNMAAISANENKYIKSASLVVVDNPVEKNDVASQDEIEDEDIEDIADTEKVVDIIEEMLQDNPNPLLAVYSSSLVVIDEKAVEIPAYNIDGNNYFKLRDIAYILSGTEKQFDIIWDNEKRAINLISGKAYTVIGGEMLFEKSDNIAIVVSTAKIYLNGEEVTLSAYNINDSTYFKLRDIGQALNFNVDWNDTDNTIIINTQPEN